MANSLYQFNFEHDQQPTENQYPINDSQWIYINDINQNNYSNGFINFTNVSVIGNSVEKQYLWSQGYLAIPYTISVAPTANLPLVVDDANVNALSIKSSTTLIDWLSVKFNGVSTTRNSYYNHLMMNERIKTYNSDKFRLYGDIMGHEWDTGSGISYSATIGERNNNTIATTLATGANPANIVNRGHLDRCSKHIDITNTSHSALASFMGAGNNSLRDTEHQNVLCYHGTDGLVYQGTAIIPLSELHDFFASMPSVASSSGFELRLQSNLSRENSYALEFSAQAAPAAGVALIPSAIVSQQIVGHCCPFLISNASIDGLTGLRIANAAITAGAKITVKACIGWDNNTGQLKTQFGGTPGAPCRIYLPAINYNNDYIKQIVQNPQYSL
jgi:hypothetical protein